VAERLAELLRGKIKIEDAGFDWKVWTYGEKREGGREGGRKEQSEKTK